MRNKLPNLAVVGITAEFRRHTQESKDGPIEYFLVISKLKTNSPELPELSIPTVITRKDVEDKTPEELIRLITNLLENTQNSLGDLIEMHRGDGPYADMYDADGRRLG